MTLNRISPRRYRCHGIPLGDDGCCNAREGELHKLGCDMERCSQCSGQFLYCDCPEPITERRRAPFFQFPLRCDKCGIEWPEFFNVPDAVWQHYILSLGHGDKLLCIDCWHLIIDATDGAAFASEHGDAIMLVDMTDQAPPGSAGYIRRQQIFGQRDGEADQA